MARRVRLCGETLREPGHICAFFDSREEKYDTIAPFFIDGIAAGDQIINVVEAAVLEDHRAALEAARVPLRHATESQQLRILTAEETYLKDGEMQLDAMLQMLYDVLSSARDEGRGVRTCGEMNWIRHAQVSQQKVLEYEARVNYFVPTFECTLLCVYDLAQTPAALVSDLLATHSFAIVKGRLRPNPYHVKADEYLEMLRQRPASQATA
jgi:hypothetical protein